ADYLQTIELGERNIAVIQRAVELLSQRRRFVEANILFQRLADQNLLPASLQRLGAEVSLEARDYALALELGRTAVSANSKNYRDLIWLGRMLSAGGMQAEAEACLRRAVELDGTAADAWVPLVQFLANAGKSTEAEGALRQAQQKLPKEKSVLAIAQCYEAVGRTDEAKESYRAALAANPDDLSTLQVSANFFLRFGLQAEAVGLLRKIVELKAKSPAEADWARRALAV